MAEEANGGENPAFSGKVIKIGFCKLFLEPKNDRPSQQFAIIQTGWSFIEGSKTTGEKSAVGVRSFKNVHEYGCLKQNLVVAQYSNLQFQTARFYNHKREYSHCTSVVCLHQLSVEHVLFWIKILLTIDHFVSIQVDERIRAKFGMQPEPDWFTIVE